MINLVATYRVQFRAEFNLADAEAILAQVNGLGVSHIYASPLLQAVPGSAHGYDGIDYARISEELGGMPALERFSEALRARGMGIILDIVPNHMAIHPRNPYWWDVLENGPASRFASFFDVQWDPPEARHADAVMLPVLGDHYGRILEAGEITLDFEGADFTVRYFDNTYPVDPATLGPLLSAAAERADVEAARDRLAFMAGAYARLPLAVATDLTSARRRYRDAAVLRDILSSFVREQPSAGRALREAVDALNADHDALDKFLRRQNYRLALWKISARELGYRRFFDINTLIGLRMEDAEVFQETHALPIDLLKRGIIDGMRIDHPDGLRDPGGYFERLRAAAAEVGRPEAWLVIEKILEPGEHMPESWPVQGTSGYDFLNRVNGLLVDAQAEAALTDFYQRFSGESADYEALVREKKIEAAINVLGSDLSRLTELFMQVCERHRRHRDYTRTELTRVLAETAACMPVYRTYGWAGSEKGSEDDRRHIDKAIQAAKAGQPDLDPRLFDFFAELLRFELPGPVEEDLGMRFQQFTGPVMAKGVEDTVFYLYNRFISLNEVGGDPGKFGVSPGDFHRACSDTQAHWPLSMLATSTHDTKRSEDVRARLNVLSEIPEQWIAAVERWSAINEHLRVAIKNLTRAEVIGEGSSGDGRWPDRSSEYLLYQTLVGAWPISADRVVEYMTKAGREAKCYTTWTTPDEEYETAVENFIRGALANANFVSSLEEFVNAVLYPGRVNALAQTLLKLTTPGVPDIYQGSELWHLALVDPDNRRPVDYPRTAALLEKLSDDTPTVTVLAGIEEGLPKLWVIRQSLALRRAHPECFGARADYTPLELVSIRGDESNQTAEPRQSRWALDSVLEGQPVQEAGEALVAVTGGQGQAGAEAAASEAAVPEAGVAFLRSEHVLVVVPRLTIRLRGVWQQVGIEIPAGRWRSLLTHERFEGGTYPLAALFSRFPVQLLVR